MSAAPAQARARRAGAWRRWHRRLAWLLVVPLAWLLLTGGLLAIWQPTQPAAAPRADPQWSGALGFQRTDALAHAVSAVEQQLAVPHRLTLRPPRAADEPILLRVSGGAWQGQVLADPVTGTPYHWRPAFEDWGHLLLELHHDLLLGDSARHVLSGLGLLSAGLVLIGLVLVGLQRNTGSARSAWARWHRWLGLALAPPLLLVLVTGAWMGAKPVAGWVSAWAGTPVEPPPRPVLLPDAPRAELALLWKTAQQTLPDGRVGYLILPERPEEAVRIRFRLPNEPHPNGLSSVWLHPQTAEVLRVRPWHALDLGSRITNWAYPLHSAWLSPTLQRPLWIALSVCSLALMFTGLRPAWRRWRNRRALARRQSEAADREAEHHPQSAD